MDYMSATEAAEKWGIGVRRVQIYCAENKIPGARYMGKQWIIPVTAGRPTDRRTKTGRASAKDERYIFPFFEYSPHFAEAALLNEHEQSLMQAQRLYLEGDFTSSLKLCRDIVASEPESHVLFGAYCMIGFNSIFMGVVSEFKSAVLSAEKILEATTSNKEDYKLMLESLKYHTTWNPDALLSIVPSRLSPEALCYYQTLIITCSAVVSTKESITALKIYETFCQRIEYLGMLPSAVVLHFLIASFYYHGQNLEKCQSHIKQACDVAAKHGWVALLAKYYYSIPTLIDRYLFTNQPRLCAQVKSLAEKSITSWRVVTKGISGNGEALLENLQAGDTELLCLMAYGLKNKEIANVLGVASVEISRRVKSICSYLKLNSREELVSYAKYHLNGHKNQ